jgi:DNA-directed RNA polymerase specialized sigma24 family protein
MKSAKAPKEKWVLTREAFERFLAVLDSDRDRAGEKYEVIRQKLNTFFRCNGFGDVEGLVDKVIDRVIRRLGEEDVRDLMAYIRGVARKVASENWKKGVKEVSLEDVPENRWQEPTAGLQSGPERQHACLQRCAKNLPATDRQLVFEYYRYEKSKKIENKKTMANVLGITVGALRVRASRIRQQLFICFHECIAEHAHELPI